MRSSPKFSRSAHGNQNRELEVRKAEPLARTLTLVAAFCISVEQALINSLQVLLILVDSLGANVAQS